MESDGYGAIIYLIGVIGGAFIGLTYGLLMSLYMGSTTGTALLIIYILLKIIEYVLFKLKKNEYHKKIIEFNKKVSIFILIILLFLLINYILYPKTFSVYI